MANKDEGTIPCKTILIGDTDVGKKSIRLINSTPGICGCCCSIKTIHMSTFKKSIKFEINDPAGQERFKAISKSFYKNASVCILIYDITRKQTFEDLKKYWIQQVKEYSSPNIIKSSYYLISIFKI